MGIQTEIISYPFNGRMRDLTGQKFGRLTVKKYIGITGVARRAVWECDCDCGNTDYFTTQALTTEKTISCGCYHKEKSSVNHSGKKFGKLTVIQKLDKVNSRNGNHYYLCKCDCGNLCEVDSNDLTCGNVSSCGCLRSRKEYEISNLLKERNIDFKQQYHFDDLKDKACLRFDFAIFKNNKLSCLLEYHGQQHYNKDDYMYRDYIEKHDKMKIEYCKIHNIPLVIINKDNYNQILDLIKEFI